MIDDGFRGSGENGVPMASNTSPSAAGARASSAGNPSLFIAIELNGANGFTGSLTVTREEQTGILFFHDGQLVHAEAGAETGEEAFRRIVGWPGGEYALDPDAIPARETISRSLDLLVAEARGQPAPPREPSGSHARAARSAEPAAGVRRVGLAAIAEQVREIPGVVGAVLHSAAGTATGRESRTPIEEQALSLSRLGSRLGELLRAGPLVLATVHGSKRTLLLLASRDQQLTILIEAGGKADAAQARIRKLLGPQA